MRAMRISAIAATFSAVVATFAYVIATEHDLTSYRSLILVVAALLAFTAVVLFSSDHIVRNVRQSTDDLLDAFCREAKALHRSMISTMESYGDARAIDAIVSTERRHAANQRSREPTSDLRNARAAITPLRRR